MMRTISGRFRSHIIAFAFSLALLIGVCARDAQVTSAKSDNGTIPPSAPELANAVMECGIGYYPTTNSVGESIYLPNHWDLARETGAPLIHSARIYYEQRANGNGGCDTNYAHVERIEGRDSVVVSAKDLETPPVPGKPFDVVLSQRIPVAPNANYSLSGWLLSLCGGSAVPSDCPDGVYIVKALGLDPQGGADPMSPSVEWVEDRRNFVDENDERIGWTNLRLGAIARTEYLTVYARLYSPFQHHGNHGFIDGISLVRAPVAWLNNQQTEVVNRRALELNWSSLHSPDIDGIDGGTYQYLIDIQVRDKNGGEWQDFAVDLPETQSKALFCASEMNRSYEFRIRARAEQPPAPPDGAWPNHRYPGAWSDPQTIRFVEKNYLDGSIEGDYSLFLPAFNYDDPCS